MSRFLDDLILHVTPDKFYLESLSEQKVNYFVVLNNLTIPVPTYAMLYFQTEVADTEPQIISQKLGPN